MLDKMLPAVAQRRSDAVLRIREVGVDVGTAQRLDDIAHRVNDIATLACTVDHCSDGKPNRATQSHVTHLAAWSCRKTCWVHTYIAVPLTVLGTLVYA